MLDAQTAAETSRLGFNLVLDGATIGLIITNIFMLLKLRKSNGNPRLILQTEKPGFAKTCISHETQLAKVETRIEEYESDVKEIKDAINDIRTVLLNRD